MLQINNACIAFGEDVLFSGFCMQVRRGETACIAGESGKGKTSLLNAIMGFVPLREGTITVGDLELNKSTIDIIRRQTAWIPQELALPVEWVKEMVRLPFELKANKNNPFSKKMLFDCFAELGLDEELYNKRVGEVSGGQRQRIMIAVDDALCTRGYDRRTAASGGTGFPEVNGISERLPVFTWKFDLRIIIVCLGIIN